MNMRIKKGDNVKVTAGKDRGKTGKVLSAHPDDGRVVVAGINLAKRRMRPRRQNEKGQTVEVPRPLHHSNLMVICSNCKAAARTAMQIEGASKFRVCKKCGART